MAKKSPTGSLPPAVPLAITPTFRPWTHTSDDSYFYQLSLVVATATLSFRFAEKSQQSDEGPNITFHEVATLVLQDSAVKISRAREGHQLDRSDGGVRAPKGVTVPRTRRCNLWRYKSPNDNEIAGDRVDIFSMSVS